MTTEKSLELVELRITKQESYQDNAGRFVAKVSYKHGNNDYKLLLGPDISETLMTYLAPVLAQSASTVTTALQEEVQRALIDAKVAARQIEASVE